MTDGPADRAAQFDALYERDPDPWDFETSAYEAQKRAATLAAIAGKRFARALELGCSTGRLTVELAEVSDRIVAVDCSATALAMAEDRLEPLRVTLERYGRACKLAVRDLRPGRDLRGAVFPVARRGRAGGRKMRRQSDGRGHLPVGELDRGRTTFP